MVNDPIADFLSRLRNAIQRNKKTLTLPSSKMLEAIAKIMKEEAFIEDFKVNKQPVQNELEITLRYINGLSAIRELIRVSKPGVRRYLGYRDIDMVKKGLGISIISTPRGVMTGKQARSEKIGGEYLCRIW